LEQLWGRALTNSAHFLLHFSDAKMSASLQANSGSEGDLSRKIAEGMLRAIKRKYGSLISTARKQWQRKYAGSDSSDSCVNIRIGTGESRELSRGSARDSRRALKSFGNN
jgi:hypothetical protein